MNEYTYDEIFQRNVGLISKNNQKKIRNSKILIVGCGGIGGWAAELLVRIGVGHIVLADPECFEVSNLNRQAASNVDTIGSNKAVVVGEMLKKINPEIELTIVSEGIKSNNISKILKSVDFVIDTIDFYAIEEEIMLHDMSRSMGKKIFLSQVAGSKATFTYFDSSSLPLSHYITKNNKVSLLKTVKFFFPEIPKEAGKVVLNKIFKGQRAPIPSCSTKPIITASLLVEDVINYIQFDNFTPVPSIGIYDFDSRTYKRILTNE